MRSEDDGDRPPPVPPPKARSSSAAASGSSQSSAMAASSSSSSTASSLSAGGRSLAKAERIPDLILLPLNPLPRHLAPYLLPHSPLTSDEKRSLFTTVFLNAASTGQSDTLEWLISIPDCPPPVHAKRSIEIQRRSSRTSYEGRDMNGKLPEIEMSDLTPRKWVDLEAINEEGTPALILCIALGHAESVRVLVEGGAEIGAQDRSGWTGLHWAVRNSDVPLASYLLNHRASTSVSSHRGLRPKDLIKKGREGATMRDVLKGAIEAAHERDTADLRKAREEQDRVLFDTSSESHRNSTESMYHQSTNPDTDVDDPRAARSRTTSGMSMGTQTWINSSDHMAEENAEVERQKRMELAIESVRNLDINLAALGLVDSGFSRRPNQGDDEMEDGIPNPFEWDRCLPDQMLVFSVQDLPVLFDVTITHFKPLRARQQRVVPANVLFLCARYAHYFGSKEMLADLFIGAFGRIESKISSKSSDMSTCTFWMSSCLLLLYYLRTEPNLSTATTDFQDSLSDLINEIVVYVIRDVELRLDPLLGPAMLDYEALPGFEDIQFEGDWTGSRFIQKLRGGRKVGAMPVSVMSLFGPTIPASAPTPSEGVASTATITSPLLSIDSMPSPGPQIPLSSRNHDLPASPPSDPIEAVSPRRITSILSSTLFILQMYEIPPSIIVQAFSQLYYWISCEVFNRMLSQRKYLYRSKAIQVRLNATSLEDWARLNQMPSKMVPLHFAPLNQLLQWLQCLSSESSIDGMIGTIQSLRSLNPLQLHRAVKEYRYEVAEPRMAVVCFKYLAQIQEQWEVRVADEREREEVMARAKGGGRQKNVSDASGYSMTDSELNAQLDVAKMIDDSFSSPRSFGHYCPPGGEQVTGEYLNSRYMLPFAVPSSANTLLSFGSRDAFGPFAATSLHHLHYSSKDALRSTSSASLILSDRSESLLRRQTSSASMLSTSTNGLVAPCSTRSDAGSTRGAGGGAGVDDRFIPILPDDFFTTLDAAKARRAAELSEAQILAAARSRAMSMSRSTSSSGRSNPIETPSKSPQAVRTLPSRSAAAAADPSASSTSSSMAYRSARRLPEPEARNEYELADDTSGDIGGGRF